MHMKIRGNTACLYRSKWMKKGADGGNTRGYAVQNYVGSISARAQSVPEALREMLTAPEVEYLMNAICAPAVEVAEQLQRSAELHERDPCWRLEEAARLVGEAAVRSADWPVALAKIAAVTASLVQIRMLDVT